jgi:16S rRNA (cytidine1402-2'-O)-methyltransferase
MPELFLIPNSLNEDHYECIPEYVKHSVKNINVFIYENPKPFRRLLVNLGLRDKINNSVSIQWDKHSENPEWWKHLENYKNENIGIISDAGSPGIADPGAEVVLWAHKNNFIIKPMSGPNSIMLGLMGSGLNGQSFSFSGYLPIKENEKIKMIKKLEVDSKQNNQTKIFIETPYRNDALLKLLLNELSNNTKLCIASDLTSKNEVIFTKRVEQWKKRNHTIGKVPCIFLILA